MSELTEPPVPEFTRTVDVSRLAAGEKRWEIAATESERAALARRFGLLDLPRLEAAVRLTRIAGGFVRLEAELVADVVQSCVVTLEPVANRIEEPFSLLYGAIQEDAAAEVVLSGEAEIVEPLRDGVIDIGEVVAQQLSLALDPYPHKPGATVESAGGEAIPSPFAALANWGKKA